MLIKRPRRWEIPEHQVTPEHVAMNRRAFVAGGAMLASGAPALAQRVDDDPSMTLYPFKKNENYDAGRPVTPEAVTSAYNNFYEYGTDKGIARAAQQLITRPWQVKIDGLVETPREVGFDDILKAMPKEERVYRFRCVEAWAMTVPWSGFPLAALVAFAKPLAGAKFIRFETFNDPKMAPGQRSPAYDWPYVEGLTMAEATNDLAFIATGIYGKPLPKQFGAPLRLAVPWKYGFKSIKSIRRISFTDKRPVGLWEAVQPMEYGFWANVNPEVSHPRWSQATEEVLGTRNRAKTQLFNGYAQEVASLYTGLTNERLYA